MEDNEKYIVYVKTDEAEHITDIGSSGFIQNTEGWTEIDRGHGNKYYHAQNRYLPGFIHTDSGVWRYKLVGGVVTECTAEDIATQEAALPQPYDESADMKNALNTLGVTVDG